MADGCFRATGCNGKLTMTLCTSEPVQPAPVASAQETTAQFSVPTSTKLTLRTCHLGSYCVAKASVLIYCNCVVYLEESGAKGGEGEKKGW